MFLKRRHIGGGGVTEKRNPSVITFLLIVLVVIGLIYLISKCNFENVEKFTNILNKVFI